MSIALTDIRHSYGAGLVVDGATVEASAGEIVCLLGPSGCGKTTLLRIAAGLERLQQGLVEIDGETVATPHFDTPAEKRSVGFVFQDFVLFPHLTVKGNIAFGLRDRPESDRTRIIREELRAVDLEPYADRYPHQLSGGQQQRAALARAFARKPKVMLLDEPLASIDAPLRRRLRSEMRRMLKARSTPAILVTHDAAEAIELGDRIAVMRDGRIVEKASPEALFHSPKTVAGASIFPGSQTIPCRPIENGVTTDFGPVAPLRRPSDAAFLVIHDGGARARFGPGGQGQVVDCRFAGPDWVVTLSARADVTLKAAAPHEIPVGEGVFVEFAPERVHALPA